MEKFDEATNFVPDQNEYYENMLKKLPHKGIAQIKHDGTCIHIVKTRSCFQIYTFLSNSNEQSQHASNLISEKDVPFGTFALELIWEKDIHVQKKRSPDGLYLFYGTDESGNFLDELHGQFSKFSMRIEVSSEK